jgi:hypothetical protein
MNVYIRITGLRKILLSSGGNMKCRIVKIGDVFNIEDNYLGFLWIPREGGGWDSLQEAEDCVARNIELQNWLTKQKNAKKIVVRKYDI